MSGHVLPCISSIAVVEKLTPGQSCEGLLSADQDENQKSKPCSGFLLPSCLSDLQSNNILTYENNVIIAHQDAF
jgi:hypothetical protein